LQAWRRCDWPAYRGSVLAAKRHRPLLFADTKGCSVPGFNQDRLIVCGGTLLRTLVDYLKLVIDLLLMLTALLPILLINCPCLLTLIPAHPLFHLSQV